MSILILAATQPTVSETLDIINKVDSFYNSAWLKLSGLLALIFVILGFVIGYGQKQLYKSSQKEMEHHFQDMFEEYSKELDKKYNRKLNEIEERIENLYKKITENRKEYELFRLNNWQRIIADYEYQDENYSGAALSYVEAISSYEFAGNTYFIDFFLERTINSVQKLRDNELININIDNQFTKKLEEILDENQIQIKRSIYEEAQGLLTMFDAQE